MELKGSHTPAELNEYIAVLTKILRIQDIILKVNQAYIYSAAVADENRTEPAFKLQGSYRNMNKLAEKVVPIMNDEELQTLILSHYEGEAQTLTSGAEANMLKLKDMMGIQSDEEKSRWKAIRQNFQAKQQLFGANADDPVVQVAAQMNRLNQQISEFRENFER